MEFARWTPSLTTVIVAGACLLGLGLGGVVLLGRSSDRRPAMEGQAAARVAGIPPLDAAAPSAVETATFAMG
ncbi:MAG: hypothetical protein ACYC5M_02280 [Anaerolineae bacterium]